MESQHFEEKFLSSSRLSVCDADLPTPPLARLHLNPLRGCVILIRPSCVYIKASNGILTVLPSTTPIGLALGPD